MKRPASEQPEGLPPPRNRRRLSSQPRVEAFNAEEPPHDSLVADDEHANRSIVNPQEVQNNLRLKPAGTSLIATNHGSRNEFQDTSDSVGPPFAGRTRRKAAVPGRSTRPLPRIKVIPPKDPSTINIRLETDSALSTPALSPEGLPAPPGSPTPEDFDEFDKQREISHLIRDGMQQDDSIIDALEVAPETASFIQNSDLFWPEHRPPTPPYYAQHFEPINVKLYTADQDALGSSGRNANTYVKKVKVLPFDPRKKKTRVKVPWTFTKCDEYPRGETPSIEMLLDPATAIEGALGLSLAQDFSGRQESEYDEDDEGEMSRDPGVPFELTVGTDVKGRYACRWASCNKTFARNDHLGRHVKYCHLRVRKFRCDPCRMAFVGLKGLRTHEKTHVIPKPTTTTEATEATEATEGGEATDEDEDAIGEDDPMYDVERHHGAYSHPQALSLPGTIGALEIEPEDEADPFMD